jgi:hypothetical protein
MKTEDEANSSCGKLSDGEKTKPDDYHRSYLFAYLVQPLPVTFNDMFQ